MARRGDKVQVTRRGDSLRKQACCKSEKWLVQLSIGTEKGSVGNKWEGDTACAWDPNMLRSMGLN